MAKQKQSIQAVGNLHLPKKRGDVGHDVPAIVEWEDMTFIENFVRAMRRDWWRNLKIVWPHSSYKFRTGIKIAATDDLWFQIQHRSSIFARGLMTVSSPIDSGYRGEVFVKLYNYSWLPRLVFHGDRIAQIVFNPAIRPTINFVPDNEFDDKTERGATGFGSSGR